VPRQMPKIRTRLRLVSLFVIGHVCALNDDCRRPARTIVRGTVTRNGGQSFNVYRHY
jgi:hypothetical protein